MDTGTQNDLPARMRERAERDGLPADHKLRELADALERAIDGFLTPKQTVAVGQFFGAWARARKAWCEYTGESLL